MFILDNPYVSNFMVDTIKKNGYKVLNNEIARQYFLQSELLDDNEAKKQEKIYSNSENSIDWVIENLPDSELAKMIKISKDKILFRKTLAKLYPDYYFREISLSEIKNINPSDLKYPFVLKPSVGFLSFGVYPVKTCKEFENIVSKLENDIQKFKNVFPQSVVDCSEFLIEEMINGDEYAIDAYFDENGEATILNIFHHPFFDENDVSDRIYYTSKEIIKKYLKPFKELLDEIAKVAGYKNFPFHLELRVCEDKIIPIEINPMRFCGWCITDIAYFAWGINPYEYFMENKKPNWDKLIRNSDDNYFYFTIGDIPSDINKNQIIDIDYEKYLKNVSFILDVRKIDYKTKPVFAIVFGKCDNLNEIKNFLKLDMKEFIELEKQ